MSVSQVKQSVGTWNVRLRGNIPTSILDKIQPFGHVAVMPGSVNVAEYGDNLLDGARYVGVYRTKATNEGTVLLSGVGLESWLGDENGGGDVFETALELTAATFATAIGAALPPSGSIISGTLHSVPGTYTGRHQWVNSRQVLDYITSMYAGSEWRVNNDGSLDAGLIADLYVTTPRAILVAKEDSSDLRYRALPGRGSLELDSTDYTTRIVVLGEGEGDTIQIGTADAVSVPYNDLHGNDVVVTRVISESYTTPTNVDARAAAFLEHFGQPAIPAVNLSSSVYDIKGDVVVGDYIYVYHPSVGFLDTANEVTWNGEVINPIKLRVVELSWPIRPGWTVAYRDSLGVWTDLSPYVFYEGGSTLIVVGELPRSLTGGGITEPIGPRPSVDTSMPDVPVFGAFAVGSYQSVGTNDIKSAIRANWSTPLNTDASTILDGAFYEIRYRVSEVMGYDVMWADIDGIYKWGTDGIGGNPWSGVLSDPVSADPEWTYQQIGWGINEVTLIELTPGVEYEIQVRAVDGANPPHFGAWSASSFVNTVGDMFAPSTPAAPTVAGNMASIQVSHTLGKSSGGTYNLEADTVRLTVHVGGSASFHADETNQVGELAANIGMMQGEIAAVGTFGIPQIEEVYVKVMAIDRAGNKSSASVAATVTAELIDDSHITSLTVSKLTAGMLTANTILGASIRTGETGARVELSALGLIAYNQFNQATIQILSATGEGVFTGQLQTGIDGKGVIITPGVQPKIVMIPANVEADHYGELLTLDDPDFGALTRLANRKIGVEDQDGGVIQLWQYGTIISHKILNETEQFIGLGWPIEDHLYIQGKWTNNLAPLPDDAFFIAQIQVTAGFTSWTHNYGATMNNNMAPVYGLYTGGGIIVTNGLTGMSSTSFTVKWTGTDAHYINAWVPRLGPSF